MSTMHYALCLAPVHAEVGGYPELVHGHGVHGREVSLHQLHAPLVVVADAEVLLEVEGVLCHPEWVSHVGLDPLHALDTLLAGDVAQVSPGVAHTPRQADVLRTVHKEVVYNLEQHRNIVIG